MSETEQPVPPPSAAPPAPAAAAAKPQRITLVLKSAGNAPQLKQTKFHVARDKTVAWVLTFLRKATKLDASESLFLYVNQSFSPSLDFELGPLYDCYKASDSLLINYATTPAWG